MKQIIFATGNAGKMKEIREILDGTGWNVLSLKDAGIDAAVSYTHLDVYKRQSCISVY